MNSKQEGRLIIGGSAIAVGLCLLIFGLCMGPSGVKTQFAGWQASAYGSDWLVVQYAQSGCVLASYELRYEAIQNEPESDGIYFVTEPGPVVHLSGHYIYVQKPTDAVRDQLLATGYCADN